MIYRKRGWAALGSWKWNLPNSFFSWGDVCGARTGVKVNNLEAEIFRHFWDSLFWFWDDCTNPKPRITLDKSLTSLWCLTTIWQKSWCSFAWLPNPKCFVNRNCQSMLIPASPPTFYINQLWGYIFWWLKTHHESGDYRASWDFNQTEPVAGAPDDWWDTRNHAELTCTSFQDVWIIPWDVPVFGGSILHSSYFAAGHFFWTYCHSSFHGFGMPNDKQLVDV